MVLKLDPSRRGQFHGHQHCSVEYHAQHVHPYCQTEETVSHLPTYVEVIKKERASERTNERTGATQTSDQFPRFQTLQQGENCGCLIRRAVLAPTVTASASANVGFGVMLFTNIPGCRPLELELFAGLISRPGVSQSWW